MIGKTKMSRGPGKVERAVLDRVAGCYYDDTVTLTSAVFGVDCDRLTAAQLGSVRRVLRRLEARGVVRRLVLRTAEGRILWDVLQPRKSAPRKSGAAKKPAAVPPIVSPEENQPLDPSRAIFGNPDANLPFAASTRVLGLRRNPVQSRRRRRPGDQGIY